MIRLLTIAAAAVLLPLVARAQPCPGNPDALGTARGLAVDARTTPRVGHKEFTGSLALRDKELVLTFDDGPWPGTTPKVLDALKHECVRATFFLIGRSAAEYPALARRELAEGHTIGHHTYSHALLDRLPIAAAEAQIDRGIEEDELALYGRRRREPTTPFFRFPGFASTPALLDRLGSRDVVVFGADVWASDWNPMTPEQELQLILARIERVNHGIVLFHDTKAQTARMLPAFLRALKKRGYRIVQAVPAAPRLTLSQKP
ncbi:MAG TPA: polysaccharide deacetylase family protein [Pseudolabrys sp.]|nr:polysaccharide deacetylase family protein [Pseudolabrys sp.]